MNATPVSVPALAGSRPAMRFSMPNLMLRLEGLAMFAAAVIAYIAIHANGWLFLILLLSPDLAMIGYVRNPRLGAIVYDVVHLIVWPLALILIGALSNPAVPGESLPLTLGLIWLAHIGMDRTVGYGLKYASAFKDTHLNPSRL